MREPRPSTKKGADRLSERPGTQGERNDGPDRRRFLKIAATAAAMGYAAPRIEVAQARGVASGVPPVLPLIGFNYARTVQMGFADGANTTYNFTFDVTIDIDTMGLLTTRPGGTAVGTFVSGNNAFGTINLTGFAGTGQFDPATGALVIPRPAGGPFTMVWNSTGVTGAQVNLAVTGLALTLGWSLSFQFSNEPPLTAGSMEADGILQPRSPDIVGDDDNDKGTP